MSTNEAFRRRMLERVPMDSLVPGDLSSLIPELPFKPADLGRWKLLGASLERASGGSRSTLSRMYEMGSSSTFLIVETPLSESAHGAIAGGTTRLYGRPANLQSIVDDHGRGAAAFAWSADHMFYMLRLWMDDTTSRTLIETIRRIAQAVDAAEKRAGDGCPEPVWLRQGQSNGSRPGTRNG